MKLLKLSILLSVLIALLFTAGCDKKIESITNTTPIIKTDSVPTTDTSSNNSQAPTLTITTVTNVTKSKAFLASSITLEGSSAVTEQGFVYDTVSNPTVEKNKVKVDSSTSGNFSYQLINLEANVIYYVRAYATNSFGTSYGAETTFTTTSLFVGQLYQGGTILYLDASGRHGLIVARSNTGETKVWGCSGTNVATSTDFGTGQANTNAILAACGDANAAAKFCNDVVIDGYNDWFLPSRDELKLAYSMRAQMQLSPITRYSSSQIDAATAWAVGTSVTDGGQLTKAKTDSITVRAFRDF